MRTSVRISSSLAPSLAALRRGDIPEVQESVEVRPVTREERSRRRHELLSQLMVATEAERETFELASIFKEPKAPYVSVEVAQERAHERAQQQARSLSLRVGQKSFVKRYSSFQRKSSEETATEEELSEGDLVVRKAFLAFALRLRLFRAL